MTTKFRMLFTVGITHAYYSGRCKDFAFVVPADTAQALRNGKLLAKVRDGKLHVLLEADAADAALASATGMTLRFGLVLLKRSLANVTAFDFDFRSARPLYRNGTQAEVLDAAEERILVGKMFSHAFTDSARPVTATLKDRHGRILQTETIEASHDRSTVSYDLTSREAGPYTVEEDYSSTTGSRPYYVDTELHRQGVLGVLEIEIGGGFYSSPPDFEIIFHAKEETLKYYVVAKNFNDADLDQLTVTDVGFADDGRPQVHFTKVAVASFTPEDIAPALLLAQDGGAKAALFKSQSPVARQDKARRKIQLKKNGEVLIKNLPQPAEDQAKADVIFQLSKP